MKKKVPVNQLALGMYVSELDRPWRSTPFLFQGFEIRTTEELEQLRQLCQYVYIDTEQSYASSATRKRTPAPRAVVAQAEPKGEVPIPGFTVVQKLAFATHRAPRYTDATTLEQELPRAREVVKNAREFIHTLTDDLRAGRNLDVPQAKALVASMVESILANPDALICFNELKDRDAYTAQHSLRVCVLALTFGRHLELTDDELKLLGLGALLHDVGKVKVPLEVLNKPARLTDEEFAMMKRHVPDGVAILELQHGIPSAAIDVARYHHERYSGRGYIAGLNGESIGLFGSMGAIVDCYDAITSDRVYHVGMSPHEALRKMYEWRERDFHPGLIEQFIQCMGIYPIGSLVELNTGAVGVVVTVNRRRRLRPQVVLVLDGDKRPMPKPKVIDLMEQPLEGPALIEIQSVLPPGTHGVRPTDYMPVTI